MANPDPFVSCRALCLCENDLPKNAKNEVPLLREEERKEDRLHVKKRPYKTAPARRGRDRTHLECLLIIPEAAVHGRQCQLGVVWPCVSPMRFRTAGRMAPCLTRMVGQPAMSGYR